MSADNARDRIMLAAGPIFARKGFRQTTVREICEAANVNLASVNYYFGDKQNLYAEMLAMARDMRAREFPVSQFDPSTPAEKKLKQIVLTMLNRVMAMQSEPWQVRLLVREVMQPSEALKPLVEAHFRPFFETLLMIVDEIAPQKLPDWKRRQIGMSIVGQIMHYRFSGEMVAMLVPEEQFNDHFQINQLAEHITEFSVAAIHSVGASIPSLVETEHP